MKGLWLGTENFAAIQTEAFLYSGFNTNSPGNWGAKFKLKSISLSQRYSYQEMNAMINDDSFN